MIVQGAKQGSDWRDWFGEVDGEELVGKELFKTPIYSSRQQS